MRPLLATIAIACSVIFLAACGSEGVSVSSDASAQESEGAEVFAEKCSGCHTIGAAGTQGSGNRALRAQGPNFDQRVVGYDEALFAIRNGGFTGAIMPQNIVVGEEADAVARFIAGNSGADVEEQPRPSQEPTDEIETGQDNVEAGDVSQEPSASESGDPAGSDDGGSN